MTSSAFGGPARTTAPRLAPSLPDLASAFRRAIEAVRGGAGVHLAKRGACDIARETRQSRNGGDYRRADPGTISGPPWIREMVADAHAAEPVRVPPAGVVVIEDAVVAGEGVIYKTGPGGSVIVRETLHNDLFDHSFAPLRRDGGGAIVLPDRLRPQTRLVGPHVCLRQIWDANYGHWLVEVLPRVAVVAEHYDLRSLKFIVSRNSEAMRCVTRESLAAFGIRPDQIVEVTRRPVAVDELIYPLPMTIHPWIKAPRAISILEELGAEIAAGRAPGPKRLYVTRAGAAQRHLRNEAAVLEALDPFDFTIVRPEIMSFAEQVRMFSGAEIIVGNYGANLTNAVFAPRGLALFALTTEAMCDDFFWDLTNLKGGRYHSLHGPAAARRADMNADFRIDLLAFRRRLDILLR